MTISTTMDLGNSNSPKRPTNRMVNIGHTKGVTVVNMSGDALRRHSEILELRRAATKYRKDLEDSMNALSIANLEIERLRGIETPNVSEIERLKRDNESLANEIVRCKDIEKLLKDENADLRRHEDDVRAELKNIEAENGRLRNEASSLKDLIGRLNDRIKVLEASCQEGQSNEQECFQLNQVDAQVHKKRRRNRTCQDMSTQPNAQQELPVVNE